MPWQEKNAERLRMEFIVAYQSEQYSFTELCELFGISRETGYYCVRRFREDGVEGLKERSRAPKSCPHRVDPVVEQLLIEARRRHPHVGTEEASAVAIKAPRCRSTVTQHRE
jgi:transposase